MNGPIEEVIRLGEATRRGWRDGHRPIASTVAVVAVGLMAAMRHGNIWTAGVDRISAVDAHQPLMTSLLRAPLSTFAPAIGLPVWGSLLQVAIVGTVAELVLRTGRLVVLSAIAQYAATLAGRLAATLGPHRCFGLPPEVAFVRDTGPSAVVVAIGLATAVVTRAYWLAAAAVAVLAAEIVRLNRLSGREHLAAIAVGTVAGFVFARRRAGP